MPEPVRAILNVLPEMLPARDPSTLQFPFLYSRQERKSKIVEDLILYDEVIVRTEHFHELAWLSTWLPFSVLRELLKTQAVKCVWDPWLVSASSAIAFPSVGMPKVWSGRILDVCGLPKTVHDKVIVAFNYLSQYDKGEIFQIADVIERTTVEVREDTVRQARESAETDLSDYEFVASCFKALTGNEFSQHKIALYNTDIQVFPYDGYVVLTNIYLALMAELGITHLRSPNWIQKTVAHKSEWLSKRLSLSQETRKNLTKLFKVTGVPNIRVLFQRGGINSKNLLELRDSAKDFRVWLHLVIESQDVATSRDDSLVKAYIKSLERISPVNSLPIKTLRFAITSGVGLIPVVGNIASVGLSAFDTFLLEKLAQGWQPKVFIDTLRRLTSD